MGDYGDFITPKDKRWADGQIAPWVDPADIGESVRDWLVDLLTPIKHQCVGLIYGNHEVSYSKQNDGKVHEHICKDLELPNLSYSCFIRFKFGRENSSERHMVTGCFTHGATTAVTEGAKLNALVRWMKQNNADIYAMGHVHDYIQKSVTRLNTNERSKIGNHLSMGVTTGSWFRTYTQGVNSSYGEQKCYPPNELNCAMFTINPNTGFLDVSRSV